MMMKMRMWSVYCIILTVWTCLVVNATFVMDVDWALQGVNLSFSGFFTEYLGYSSAIRELMPHAKLSLGSYRKYPEEPRTKNDTKFFVEDMFELESRNTIFLYNNSFPSVNFESADPICQDSSLYQSNIAFTGTELARGKVYDAHSSEACCRACTNSKLCTSFTYDTIEGCKLHGQKKYLKQESVSTAISGVIPGRNPVPNAIIFHGTTCSHKNVSRYGHSRDINTIYIGRYMVERESIKGGFLIDDYAVFTCASIMDEIWVPSTWHVNVFRDVLRGLGFSMPSIYVIPEAVDTTLFDPMLESTKRYDKFFSQTQFSFAASADVPTPLSLHISSDGELYGDRFVFLSIFKWEYRKGWATLLEAYWTAFTKEDPVVLRIRTFKPKYGPITPTTIYEEIVSLALKLFQKYPHELADIVIDPKEPILTRPQMRQLYAQADAFVLPTYGEGWGLPIAEAMAMEVPVIVTNATGIQAYANELNAYLISVLPTLDHLSYVQPNVTHLVELMHDVVIDSIRTQETPIPWASLKGQMARATMKEFSPTHAVKLMIDRLKYHATRRGYSWDADNK